MQKILTMLNFLTLLDWWVKKILTLLNFGGVHLVQAGMTPRKAEKRAHILSVARAVFEEEGLEGASLRSIATRAGYTPAALYFHFDSKEALYEALLHQSLEAMKTEVGHAVDAATGAKARLQAAALAFFDYYHANPRELDLGFYLFRGGMTPKGLGRERDMALNHALLDALQPIGEAAIELGQSKEEAEKTLAAIFAHASGLLLLAHTGRIGLFTFPARDLLSDFVDGLLAG